MRRLALIAVLVGVCGPGGSALAADSSQPYLGTWAAHLSLDQLYHLGLDPRLAGKFRLVLRRNGTYTTFNSLDGSSRGRFTTSGRRIVFAHDVGCETALGVDQAGVYRWSIAQGRLKLTPMRVGSDPCGGRWQTLTYPIWTKRVGDAE